MVYNSFASSQTINVTASSEKIAQYEPIKFTLSLPYYSKNPNDAASIKIEAKITAPDGEKLIAPLFCLSNSKTKKHSLWEGRFTPVKTGKYGYYVLVESESLNQKTEPFFFEVIKSDKAGFLREAKNNPYYLVFDSGKPFFGIGYNVAWVLGGGILAYDRYFSKMNKNACNMVRIWLCDWSFPLEWGKIGDYDQVTSSNLDKLIELAGERGMYIILSLDTYGSLMEEKGPWGENRWQVHPYNKKNGGFCESPKDFFTNPEAKKWYKNRLRYIVSRWSYSPNILAFELWNEYNAPVEWIKEMAEYIKSIDPHRHFITTSFGYPWEDIYDKSDVWQLKDIGIISEHTYGDATEESVVPRLMQIAREDADRFKKPFIFSEVGIDASKDDLTFDFSREGTALHNSIWATSISKSFGTSMNWWWDSYLKGEELYMHYKALAEFLKGINWDSKTVEYTKNSLVMLRGAKSHEALYKDVEIKPQDRWGKIYINEFTVLNNGDLSGGGMPSKYLHGLVKQEMKNDHVFNVEYSAKGKFIIKVGTVSQGGHLHVFIDEKEVASKEFPAGPGTGPWKKSLYLKKYNVYQCIYNEDFVVEVPEGRHAIRLSNSGKDWIGIEKIVLIDYVASTLADARCLGLVIGDEMIFWIQNKASNWKNTFYKVKIDPIKDAYFDIFESSDGTYKIEWWDTYKGVIISEEKVKAVNGILHIRIPKFLKDIACKIKKEVTL